MFHEMIDSGITPDVYAWNALLHSFTSPHDMRHTLFEMQNAQCEPNSYTYAVYFNCLLKHSHSDEVVSLYRNHLESTPSLVDSAVATAVFCALGNVGDIADISSFWHTHKNLLYK